MAVDDCHEITDRDARVSPLGRFEDLHARTSPGSDPQYGWCRKSAGDGWALLTELALVGNALHHGALIVPNRTYNLVVGAMSRICQRGLIGCRSWLRACVS